MSSLELYCTQILDGKITACETMKQVSDRLLNNLYTPDQYHFDPDLARKHVDFIERFCKTPSGKIGTPLRLELYQKAQLEAIFGFVDDNNLRQYNEAFIVEGRKNGKSTLLSAVLIDMLINDGEGSPQCVTAATQLDQAKLTFNAAHKMIMQSPLLSKHIRKRASDLYYPGNLGYIKALASNTNSLDGLDLHCAIIDELAALKNRGVYDLLKQGMSARTQPLLCCITTNNFIRHSVFDSQFDYAKKVLSGEIQDKRFLPFLYTLDSPEEWTEEDAWIKANPGLGTIKSKQFLRECVQKAKDDAAFFPTVMVKDFNIPQTSESSWLRYEDLNNEETFDIPFKYCIGGFDAADSVDLNAAKAVCMRPGDDRIYVRSMYWLPQAVIDAYESQVGDRDNAPYKLWIQQGLMRTCPGNRCDKRIFLDWFRELRDEHGLYTVFIGYDPWHVSDAEVREFKAEFGQNSMIPVRQGTISLSEPMKLLAADFQAHRIVYNNNPIDKWCLINTDVKTDVNGNIQPVKKLDRRLRIDGTAALIDAYKVLQDKKDQFIGLNSGV